MIGKRFCLSLGVHFRGAPPTTRVVVFVSDVNGLVPPHPKKRRDAARVDVGKLCFFNLGVLWGAPPSATGDWYAGGFVFVTGRARFGGAPPTAASCFCLFTARLRLGHAPPNSFARLAAGLGGADWGAGTGADWGGGGGGDIFARLKGRC